MKTSVSYFCRLLLFMGIFLAAAACQKAGDKKNQNRLAAEKSLYLLRHAENPVDWYPWGEEAFKAAAAQDKPVLLSIGYLTCHWCRVMEEESFSSPEVGKVLNETFINIKVDREELPAIDAFYMKACMNMADACGWPLTLVLTPDRVPFYAGTYHPPRSSHKGIGLVELAGKARQMWQGDRARAEGLAADFMNILKKEKISKEKSAREVLLREKKRLHAVFNTRFGGFTDAPGFPRVQRLRFLLAMAYNSNDLKSREIVRQTLDAVVNGGIHDHAGGGYHRYATDQSWNIPHYEKMLYDQALLAIVMTEMWQYTGQDIWQNRAREILDFVLADMMSPDGTFYTAFDSSGKYGEGSVYLWEKDEAGAVLNDSERKLFAGCFKFEKTRSEGAGQRNLVITGTADAGSKCDKQGAAAELAKLREYRNSREKPEADRKIQTDWNSLMISALALAGAAYGRGDYLAAAEKASAVLMKPFPDVPHVSGAGLSAGNLDDYALFTEAQLNLFQGTGKVEYLDRAVNLNNEMEKRFRDPSGGYFQTAGTALPVRLKTFHDGETPAGNAVTLGNLIRLWRITGARKYEQAAREIVAAGIPSGSSADSLLLAHAWWHYPGYEIHVAGLPGEKETIDMLAHVYKMYLPGSTIVSSDGQNRVLQEYSPYLKGQTMKKGRVTAYVCRNFRCNFPVNDAEKLEQIFKSGQPGG